MQIIDIKSSHHSTWGNGCEVYTLLNQPPFQIMQETIPPGNRDCLHYHSIATQVLYVLSGRVTVCLLDEQVELGQGQGITIPAKQAHNVANNSAEVAVLLTVSAPGGIDDRVVS